MTWLASTARIASSSSPVLGFADCPPRTTAATPKSRKIAARPSPAATAMTPRAGVATAVVVAAASPATAPAAVPALVAPPLVRDGAAPADVFAARPAEPAAPSVGSPPVNAAAFVSRTSRAWLSRFSMLIRLRAPWLSP